MREPPAPSRTDFPCSHCGALQTFAPGTRVLRCPYCGHDTPIPPSPAVIHEHDFRRALAELAAARPLEKRTQQTQSVHCEACAATFVFDQDIHSGTCPYCGTPVVLGTEYRAFSPQSLLPFQIEQSQAMTQFRRWLKRLWFAPGGLRRYAREGASMRGVYVPYWTYDSDTQSEYRGERGDYYQVPVQYTTVVRGRRVLRTRMVTKVRWKPVRGSVSRFFDDVLVGASESLPRRITDALEPWPLERLVPFQPHYLSGFSSQVYQVDLDEGFRRARQIMDQVIRQDVARDIGGDVQRIHSVNTHHSNTRFKHLLLPVWTAGFRYKEKEYIFVVNGCTGEVKGERPYSKWKILLALVAGGILAALLLYWTEVYIR